ncbi:MAG: DUF58 domain-containing protein, partial [Candidatus Woesearchaeota archaeon]|nr:DUF58 domain-containing protein [Candidatus Woesearchaeota archaeon]
DWRVYARTDDLYIRRYEEERNLSVHIILDASASMNFGAKMKKFDYAAMIGVGFGYLAMKSNEKIQFSTFGEDLMIFKPKRGMNQLASMVDHLNSVKPEGHSKFVESIFKYKKMINTRSLIVIVSDFLISIDDITRALYILGDHDIHVIQVLDPVERDFMLDGDLKLFDSETKDIMKTTITPRLKMDYSNRMHNHVIEIEKTCKKLGIDFFSVSTDTPIFDVFYKILK